MQQAYRILEIINRGVSTSLPSPHHQPSIPLAFHILTFLKIAMSPYNLFSFAHLGMEIKLQSKPHRCFVTGNQFPHGSHVRIRSAVQQPSTAGLSNGTPGLATPNGILTPNPANGNGAYSPMMNGNGSLSGAGSPNPFDGALTPVSASSPYLGAGAGTNGGLKLNGLKLNGTGTGPGSSPALSPFLKTEFGDRPGGSRHVYLTSDEECASPTYQDVDLPLPLPPYNGES